MSLPRTHVCNRHIFLCVWYVRALGTTLPTGQKGSRAGGGGDTGTGAAAAVWGSWNSGSSGASSSSCNRYSRWERYWGGGITGDARAEAQTGRTGHVYYVYGICLCLYVYIPMKTLTPIMHTFIHAYTHTHTHTRGCVEFRSWHVLFLLPPNRRVGRETYATQMHRRKKEKPQ